AESRETPMHVGGLYLFTLPEGADEQECLADLLSVLRSTTEWRRPFGHKLKLSRIGAAGPSYWVPDEQLDIEYHVRHSALPKPGRYRELFALASRLHQSLLDRHRPLWEVHVIEGLGNRQFALYSKIHHAAIDGVTGVRLAQTMLSPDPSERREHSPFSLAAHQLAKAERADSEPPTDREVKAVAEVLRESLGVGKSLLAGLRTYARAWLHPDQQQLTTSWTATPVTSFSTKITGARRFVAQSYALPRVKAVSKALGGTINDVVLAMCGGALRRYLLQRGELPSAPLTAMTPVSLRTEGNDGAGNAIGALTANLATHIADPARRFEVTRASMDEGKSLLRGMSPKEVALFTQLTHAPPLLIGMLGLGDRFPPYSTVISNLPGPRTQTYWNGARLDGMYPMSAVFHGFALNFTLVSNGDQLDFGVVACRASVPNCQRIIDHLEESLAELEGVAGLAAG
ncbi:MAG: wax ester/triacylglycerol synthase family O-acyltransferase, partial [Nannocystaceae bacterium]